MAFLEEAAGRALDLDVVAAALAEAFESELGCRLLPGAVTAMEEALAVSLRDERYRDSSWTSEGSRVRRWSA
jgi:hypothetical protein